MFKIFIVLICLTQNTFQAHAFPRLRTPSRGGQSMFDYGGGKLLNPVGVSKVLGHEPGSSRYLLGEDYFSIPGSGGATPFRVLTVTSNSDLQRKSVFYLERGAYAPGKTSDELKFAMGSFSSRDQDRGVVAWTANRLDSGQVRISLQTSSGQAETSVTLKPYSKKHRILLAEPTQVHTFTTLEISDSGEMILRRIMRKYDEHSQKWVYQSIDERMDPNSMRDIRDIFGTEFF